MKTYRATHFTNVSLLAISLLAAVLFFDGGVGTSTTTELLDEPDDVFSSSTDGKAVVLDHERRPVKTIYYDGCYKDTGILPAVVSSRRMFMTYCLSKCEFKKYVGLGNGDTCYCASVLNEHARVVKVDNSFCNLQCSSRARFSCGGKNYIALYRQVTPG